MFRRSIRHRTHRYERSMTGIVVFVLAIGATGCSGASVSQNATGPTLVKWSGVCARGHDRGLFVVGNGQRLMAAR